MTLQLPRPLFGLTLLIAVILSWWAIGPEQEGEQVQLRPVGHEPDYYGRQVSIISMGPSGTPVRLFRGSRLVHYADDGSTEVDGPRYTLYREDGPPWNIQSSKGWLSADGEQALLSGRVTLLRAKGPNNAAMKLVTRDLMVQPGQYYAETDEPVDAHVGLSRIRAIGMQGWLKEPARLKLLSKARGHYAP